ncbi:MAG: bifunctional DNA primase/polymerase, partial [Dehalococcoidia bacterium]|nr:bifunctional DNA primase/polymerase [Dehalococcoidia bacterium]
MVTTRELLNAALRYAELGYRVFPCTPGGKAPLTPHGFHDAMTDAEQIEHWWAQHPRANIGIPTTGLVVIDSDGEANSWPNDPDHAADLASAGAIALTPRGGRHLVFRRHEGNAWKCSTGKLAPGVDVRTDGGYIVVPPSRTMPGAYRWAPDLELDQRADRLPEPPAWLVQELDALTTTPRPSANGTPTLAHVAAGGGQANAIPEGQRNATLAKLAGAMRRVGMSQAEIAAALLQTNKDRCVPPLSPREVEHIAESVARYEPDSVSVALAENHFDQMFAEGTADETPANPDPGPIPDELLRVPGFIDEVMQYTLDTAPYPEPVLAFAGALALQAFLAGRKVRDAMDNRTNLYVLSLANSGVGKDHARKVNARILLEAGLANGLGTSFASGEGIEDRLFVQPATLFQVDEIDGLLLRVSQAKDARHEQIVSMLLQMYSAASTVYVMRAKAGRERTVIDQPCLCLFGTAVPKHFYEALSSRLLTNGFLARLLILECRRRGAGRDDTERPIPESILAAARWWADFRPGGNLSEEHPVPTLVPHTAEAQAVFRDVRERADAEYDQAQSQNDPA